MRIGIYLSSIEHQGGAIRVAITLANAWAKRHEVIIFEAQEHARCAFEVDSRVCVVALGVSEPRIRGQFKQVNTLLGDALRVHPVDVMLGISYDFASTIVRPCRRARIPLIFCDHGALCNQLADRKATLLRAYTAHRSHATVVLTDQTKADYKRILRVPARKLTTIYNWIPQSLLDRAEHYDSSLKRIVWAGRLDAEKGVDLLWEIARRVLPAHPDWTWDVYGEAVLKSNDFDIVHAIQKAGLEKQLILRGSVTDMYERYNSYSIGVLTSYREGLPLFLLEAKACGLPLISFDVDTGPRDIIEEDLDGFLIEPYDVDAYAERLSQLMEHQDLREEFSRRTKQSAHKFSEAVIDQEWEELLQRVTHRL